MTRVAGNNQASYFIWILGLICLEFAEVLNKNQSCIWVFGLIYGPFRGKLGLSLKRDTVVLCHSLFFTTTFQIYQRSALAKAT